MATLFKDDVRPTSFTEAEWKVRVDLAAFYRLSALYGWDDFIYTHISARVPGPDHHFLINPFGLMFDEITASSLVKVDIDGNIIGEGEYGINYAGYVIHSAIHAAREDAHFIAHFHSPDGMGVSAHAEGLLPLNQRALAIIPRLSYHDYEGVALNLDERERLVADLGDTRIMLLRNHGTLALGATPGEAWSGNLSDRIRLHRAGAHAFGGPRQCPDRARGKRRRKSAARSPTARPRASPPRSASRTSTSSGKPRCARPTASRRGLTPSASGAPHPFPRSS